MSYQEHRRVLIIDNFDSFTFNLVELAEKVLLGQEYDLKVGRNNAITCSDIDTFNPTHIVISPGPGNHTAGGICHEVLAMKRPDIPILGVCLGHQLLAYSEGANIIQAPAPIHGHQAIINHSGDGIFAGIPNDFLACRYHSLVVSLQTSAAQYRITATTDTDLIMGIQHQTLPWHGVQFHPESFLTQYGDMLVKNLFELSTRQVL